MRKMKKFLAVFMVAAMTVGMGTTVFAGDIEEYEDQSTVTIEKTYAQTNSGNQSDEESFTLEQIGDGVVLDGEATSAPALSFTATDAISSGEEGSMLINLPTYTNPGIYQYTVQETAGSTAGVTYDQETYYVKVTVINGIDGTLIRVPAVHKGSADGEKIDAITNTYSGGDLEITKTVEGNLGDKTQYFEFTVVLTGETGKTYTEPFDVSGGSYAQNPSTIMLGTPTIFHIKDGDTITIDNLPYGVVYTVTEDEEAAEKAGYTVTKTGDKGTISSDAVEATFTNAKEGTPDTGIFQNNMPYVIMIIVIAGAAVSVIVIRKNKAKR